MVKLLNVRWEGDWLRSNLHQSTWAFISLCHCKKAPCWWFGIIDYSDIYFSSFQQLIKKKVIMVLEICDLKSNIITLNSIRQHKSGKEHFHLVKWLLLTFILLEHLCLFISLNFLFFFNPKIRFKQSVHGKRNDMWKSFSSIYIP